MMPKYNYLCYLQDDITVHGCFKTESARLAVFKFIASVDTTAIRNEQFVVVVVCADGTTIKYPVIPRTSFQVGMSL